MEDTFERYVKAQAWGGKPPRSTNGDERWKRHSLITEGGACTTRASSE
jgi:hypothetical protein